MNEEYSKEAHRRRSHTIDQVSAAYEYVHRYLHDEEGKSTISMALAGPLEGLLDGLAELAGVQLVSDVESLTHPIEPGIPVHRRGIDVVEREPDEDPQDRVRITSVDTGRDGVTTVQIDTEKRVGRIRISLNDASIWDGDPEADEPAHALSKALNSEHRDQVSVLVLTDDEIRALNSVQSLARSASDALAESVERQLRG